ncbi:MAG: PKD domain-containing protein, partial [Bacteroidota bacterium]|nr:PKD domain-containing protein [Bacteroidota bacterium]
MRPCLLILFFATILCNVVIAQSCNEKGQTPYAPIKICSTVISKTLQSNCKGNEIASICSTKIQPTDVNATWYSFSSSADDTLGFVIEPFDLSDDFNWVLYDITG